MGSKQYTRECSMSDDEGEAAAGGVDRETTRTPEAKHEQPEETKQTPQRSMSSVLPPGPKEGPEPGTPKRARSSFIPAQPLQSPGIKRRLGDISGPEGVRERDLFALTVHRRPGLSVPEPEAKSTSEAKATDEEPQKKIQRVAEEGTEEEADDAPIGIRRGVPPGPLFEPAAAAAGDVIAFENEAPTAAEAKQLARVAELRKEVSVLEKRLIQAESQLELQSEREQAVSQLLREELEQLGDEKKEYARQNAELERQLQQCTGQVAALQSDVVALTGEKERALVTVDQKAEQLKDRVAALKTQNRDLKKLLKTTQKELDACNRQNQELARQLDETEMNRGVATGHVEELAAQVAGLQDTLSEHQREAAGHRAQAVQQLNQMNGQVQELQAENTRLQAENARLQAENKATDKAQQQTNAALQKQLTKTQAELELCKQSIESERKQNEQLDRAVQNARRDREAVATQHEAAVAFANEEAKRLMQVNQALGDAEERANALDKQLKDCQAAHTKCQVEANAFQEQLRGAEQKFREQDAKLDGFNGELKEYQERISKLVAEKRELEDSRLVAQVDDQKAQADLRARFQTLELQLRGLQGEVTECTQARDVANGMRDAAQKTIDQVRAELAASQHKQTTLERQMADLTVQYNEAARRRDSCTQQLGECQMQQAQHEQKIAMLQGQLAVCRQAGQIQFEEGKALETNAKERVRQLKHRINTQQDHIRGLEARLAAAPGPQPGPISPAAHQQQILSLQAQLAAYQQQNTDLQTQLTQEIQRREAKSATVAAAAVDSKHAPFIVWALNRPLPTTVDLNVLAAMRHYLAKIETELKANKMDTWVQIFGAGDWLIREHQEQLQRMREYALVMDLYLRGMPPTVSLDRSTATGVQHDDTSFSMTPGTLKQLQQRHASRVIFDLSGQAYDHDSFETEHELWRRMFALERLGTNERDNARFRSLRNAELQGMLLYNQVNAASQVPQIDIEMSFQHASLDKIQALKRYCRDADIALELADFLATHGLYKPTVRLSEQLVGMLLGGGKWQRQFVHELIWTMQRLVAPVIAGEPAPFGPGEIKNVCFNYAISSRLITALERVVAGGPYASSARLARHYEAAVEELRLALRSPPGKPDKPEPLFWWTHLDLSRHGPFAPLFRYGARLDAQGYRPRPELPRLCTEVLLKTEWAAAQFMANLQNNEAFALAFYYLTGILYQPEDTSLTLQRLTESSTSIGAFLAVMLLDAWATHQIAEMQHVPEIGIKRNSTWHTVHRRIDAKLHEHQLQSRGQDKDSDFIRTCRNLVHRGMNDTIESLRIGPTSM